MKKIYKFLYWFAKKELSVGQITDEEFISIKWYVLRKVVKK